MIFSRGSRPSTCSAIGAVTVADGVVYGCSFVGTGTAMNASTGAVLWSRMDRSTG